MKINWPEKSLEEILGSGLYSLITAAKMFPCQVCEHNFKFQEKRDNGKKSKTWTIGRFVWGEKEPQQALCFAVKCHTCGNLVAIYPLTRREAATLVEAKEVKPAAPREKERIYTPPTVEERERERVHKPRTVSDFQRLKPESTPSILESMKKPEK